MKRVQSMNRERTNQTHQSRSFRYVVWKALELCTEKHSKHRNTLWIESRLGDREQVRWTWGPGFKLTKKHGRDDEWRNVLEYSTMEKRPKLVTNFAWNIHNVSMYSNIVRLTIHVAWHHQSIHPYTTDSSIKNDWDVVWLNLVRTRASSSSYLFYRHAVLLQVYRMDQGDRWRMSQRINVRIRLVVLWE